MTFAMINGQVLASDEARVSIADRGFRFGDGLFETIAVYGRVPYQFDYHMARLSGGLAALKIDYPVQELAAHCRTLMRQNQFSDGLLRIQITRGIGSFGYLPDGKHPQAGATCVIETMARPSPPAQRVKLWVSSYQKPSPLALPAGYKLCQGVNSTLARLEARENDCFDALMLDSAGRICETSSANIFWQSGGIIFTPALTGGALAGSTRAALIRLLPEVREVEAGLEQLEKADAVAMTNASLQVVAVSGLLPRGWQWQSEEFASGLQARLAKDIDETTRNGENYA